MTTLQLLKQSYLELQVASNYSVRTAIRTDEIRASLRNRIATLEDKSCQEVQEENETKSFLISK